MKPKNLLTFAGVLLIPMLALSIHLFKGMSPELQDLLPLKSKYLKDVASAAARVYGRESLILWIESPTPGMSGKLQEILTTKLEQAHLPLVASVESRLGPEAQFFYDRMGYFLSTDDLKKVENEMAARVTRRKQQSPNTAAANWTPGFFEGIKDFIVFKKWTERFTGFLSRYTRFKDGWYRTPDQKISLIILRSQITDLRLGDALSLQSLVDHVVNQTRKEYPQFSNTSVRFTGTIRHLIEDNQSLYRDIGTSTALVLFLVGMSLWIYFRSFRDIFYLVGSLTFGFLLSLSGAAVFFHPMNANAAFMTSIVIGNGINFGIIILTRIRETGNINQALKETRIPTLLAMLGGVTAYGSLALTDFRGFQQFGTLGVLGMFSCWLSATLIIPAIIQVFEKNAVIQWPAQKTIPITPQIQKGAWGIAVCGCIALLIALLSPKFPLLYETNLGNLRDQKNMKEGSISLSLKVDQIFDETLSPMVILASSREKASAIAKNLLNPNDPDNKTAKIANVISLDQLIPENQDAKLVALKNFKKKINSFPEKFLTASELSLLSHLTHAAELKPFTEADLPSTVTKLFEEKSGERGRIVYLESLNQRNSQDLLELKKTFQALNKHTHDTDPAASILGSSALTLAITQAVESETQKVTVWIFIVMIIFVLILYRTPKNVLWIISSWFFGLLLFYSLILLTHTKIHMINFLAIPITVGIGIDYATNLFSRLKEESFFSAFKAVLLCSLTTSLGYAALLSAGNLGLHSFAKLALFGELSCLLAAALWGLARRA